MSLVYLLLLLLCPTSYAVCVGYYHFIVSWAQSVTYSVSLFPKLRLRGNNTPAVYTQSSEPQETVLLCTWFSGRPYTQSVSPLVSGDILLWWTREMPRVVVFSFYHSCSLDVNWHTEFLVTDVRGLCALVHLVCKYCPPDRKPKQKQTPCVLESSFRCAILGI